MRIYKPTTLLLGTLFCTCIEAAPAKGRIPWSVKHSAQRQESINDASRLNETAVREVWKIPGSTPEAEEQLRSLLKRAHMDKHPVSIAGARHSMGGHTIAPDGIVIDMRPFNKLELREGGRILRAGAGTLWSAILPFLENHGLSVSVMQSNNSFSVGGSLSVNCHGWQFNRPPIASTVESFRLMKADGSILTCSRNKNQELFSLALGGYGLFGIILNADLRTTANKAYRIERRVLPIAEAIPYYEKQLKDNAEIDMAYARLNIVPKKLFEDVIISTFRPLDNATPPPLKPPSKVLLRRSIFRFSAKSSLGKKLRWKAETSLEPKLQPDIFSRNQLLNEDVEVFGNRSPFSTDILHEYFVPSELGYAFIHSAGRIILAHRANLLNITIRSVNEDKDTFLRYADRQMLCFVMLFNHSRRTRADEAMQAVTRELVEAAMKLGGRYYLPYRLHASREQFHRAYPMAREFFSRKKAHDPEGLFHSLFYEKYGADN